MVGQEAQHYVQAHAGVEWQPGHFIDLRRESTRTKTGARSLPSCDLTCNLLESSY
jgi:hypothetical protein